MDEDINIKTGDPLVEEFSKFFGEGINERETSELMAKLDQSNSVHLAPLYQALEESNGRYHFKTISTPEELGVLIKAVKRE